MSDGKKFINKLKQGNEDEVASVVADEKRLVRLGIDPDGDPIEIMRQVSARLKELKEQMGD